MNRFKSFILILSIFLVASATAQDSLTDLVPYRKGKLWGLVHSDMKPFYPAVFDSIIWQGEFFSLYGVSVFGKSNEGDMVAKVIHKGQKKYLTANKQLKPASFELDGFSMPAVGEVEELMEAKIGLPPPEGDQWEEPFYADAGQSISIRVKHLKEDSYQFYINDEHIPEFDCDDYEKLIGEFRGIHKGIIVKKKSGYGYGDFGKKKIVIPIDYSIITQVKSKSDWLIVTRNGLTGVLTTENKEIIPLRYNSIKKYEYDMDEDPYPFIVKDKSGYKLILATEKTKKESIVHYESLKFFNTGGRETRPVFHAKLKGKSGLVTQKDSALIPIKYKNFFQERALRFIILENNDKYGFVDISNHYFRKEPVYYDLISLIKTGYKKNGLEYYLFLMENGGRTFYVDNFGKEFISK